MSKLAQSRKDKPRNPHRSVRRPVAPSTRHRQSSQAVDRSVLDYGGLGEEEHVLALARARWGSETEVVCPLCGTFDEHHWRPAELRWKCRSCDKSFSVTSKTVFADQQVGVAQLRAAAFLWAAEASGAPALALRRKLNLVSYNTAFTLCHKLREGIARGYNTGLISGLVEMDGAHTSGRRASQKRGKPLTGGKKTAEEVAAENQAIVAAASNGPKEGTPWAGVRDPQHGYLYPPLRRITMSIRRRSAHKGQGALRTLVGMARTESPEVVQAFIERRVCTPESVLATDSSTAYSPSSRKFKLHLVVNHSETMVGPNGEHVNNAESMTARHDRSEVVYTNIEPKYAHEYLCETAFRDDHSGLPAGRRSDVVLFWALNVGPSKDWTGFTHGKHRDHEKLLLGNEPAAPGGRPSARSKVAVRVRLPR